MARKHRRKDAYEGSPQVPVRTDVLQAAMEARGWGPSELARTTRDSQQTISALLNSTRSDRRCREDRAWRIAKALQLPFEWLTQGIKVPATSPVVWPGYEFRYSARTEYAASRLFTRCAQACVRDSDRSPTVALHGLPVETFVSQLVGLISELVQIGRWRHWLLDWRPEVQAQRGYTEPATENPFQGKVTGWREAQPGEPPVPKGYLAAVVESQGKPTKDDDHENAILSLCRAIEHVLTPWFEDQARLNYAALYHLTSLPGAVPQTLVDPYTPPAAIPSPPTLGSTPARSPASRGGRQSRSTPRKKPSVKRRPR